MASTCLHMSSSKVCVHIIGSFTIIGNDHAKRSSAFYTYFCMVASYAHLFVRTKHGAKCLSSLSLFTAVTILVIFGPHLDWSQAGTRGGLEDSSSSPPLPHYVLSPRTVPFILVGSCRPRPASAFFVMSHAREAGLGEGETLSLTVNSSS